MRASRLSVAAVGLVLGLGGLYWFTQPTPDPASTPMTEDEAPPVREVSVDQPAAVMEEPQESRAIASQPEPEFEYARELSQYADLKATVLPSDEQKMERQRLINNAYLLKGLAERLLKRPLMPIGEQGAAIDLLIEAVQKGDAIAAEAALKLVVADAQVEQESLERSVREELAGVKAEVLYQWAAVDPRVARSLASALPGPVSRKIWDNVQAAHRSNLAASQAEAVARARGEK